MSLRLFVAIELPGEVLAAMHKVQHSLQRDPALARLRWVRPEGIHLTLKFLGETDDAKRTAIEAALSRSTAGIAPFELHLGKLGRFGSRSQPRVLWVDVGGDTAALSRLQTQVEREIAPLGFQGEARPYSAHLTLARVPPERAREVASALDEAIAGAPPPTGTIHVREVALMKSDLRREGAVYAQLFAAPLRGE